MPEVVVVVVVATAAAVAGNDVGAEFWTLSPAVEFVTTVVESLSLESFGRLFDFEQLSFLPPMISPLCFRFSASRIPNEAGMIIFIFIFIFVQEGIGVPIPDCFCSLTERLDSAIPVPNRSKNGVCRGWYLQPVRGVYDNSRLGDGKIGRRQITAVSGSSR